jgi:hypothetical protein
VPPPHAARQEPRPRVDAVALAGIISAAAHADRWLLGPPRVAWLYGSIGGRSSRRPQRSSTSRSKALQAEEGWLLLLLLELEPANQSPVSITRGADSRERFSKFCVFPMGHLDVVNPHLFITIRVPRWV